VNSWKQQDFETLNTLLMKYKETGDQSYFNQAWDKYLKDLTNSYLNKYVIRGLPVSAKKLFLVDHQYYHLQDVLYPVLIKAIHQWTPNAQNRNTRDFAAYYKQAVKNLTGNIINRYNHKMYQNLSIKQLDFNNEEELTMLLQAEPTLKEHFEHRTNLDVILMDKHVETFIKTKLTSHQVVSSVQQIATVNKNTMGEIQTVSAATEEQSASLGEISSASRALAKMAEELQIAVRNFKV